MRPGLAIGLALSLVTGAAGHAAGAEPPLKLLTSSFWGTAEDDDIQGAAEAPDGTVYMVGNVGAATKDLPGGVTPNGLGQPAAEPKCGRGFVAHFSADLTQLLHYAEFAEGKDARRERFDGGINGVRAFAADYSGKAGAAGLFALADRITGGKKKVWMWQLPRSERDGPAYTLDVQGNSFTLAHKDASLKATFLSPRNVIITQAKGRLKAHPLSGVDDAEVNAIHATGEDPMAGDFFVVMTLQKGNAPEVKIDGDKVRVGGRTVAFDGKKITIE